MKKLSGEQYREASRELKPYLKKLDLVERCFAENKISFTYYLQKPIELDPYANRIDEMDEGANQELDELIGKTDTLTKYSSRDRSKEWFNNTPITYSVDMKDRRAITFYFRDVKEGFRSFCSALEMKSVQGFIAQVRKES